MGGLNCHLLPPFLPSRALSFFPISNINMVETLSHDTLGSVQGKAINDSVTQFLGLKYATLADRFAEPVLASTSDNKIDAADIG